MKITKLTKECLLDKEQQLEDLLNDGWFLEKMQFVMAIEFGKPTPKILSILSKGIEEDVKDTTTTG